MVQLFNSEMFQACNVKVRSCNRWKTVASIAMSTAILRARRETSTAMTITCIPVQQCCVRRHSSGLTALTTGVCFSKSSDGTEIILPRADGAWAQTLNEWYIYIGFWELKWRQAVRERSTCKIRPKWVVFLITWRSQHRDVRIRCLTQDNQKAYSEDRDRVQSPFPCQ